MTTLADALRERSKNDRDIIVGSEIRAALQEQRDEIERLTLKLDRCRALVDQIDNDVYPEREPAESVQIGRNQVADELRAILDDRFVEKQRTPDLVSAESLSEADFSPAWAIQWADFYRTPNDMPVLTDFDDQWNKDLLSLAPRNVESQRLDISKGCPTCGFKMTTRKAELRVPPEPDTDEEERGRCPNCEGFLRQAITEKRIAERDMEVLRWAIDKEPLENVVTALQDDDAFNDLFDRWSARDSEEHEHE